MNLTSREERAMLLTNYRINAAKLVKLGFTKMGAMVAGEDSRSMWIREADRLRAEIRCKTNNDITFTCPTCHEDMVTADGLVCCSPCKRVYREEVV